MTGQDVMRSRALQCRNRVLRRLIAIAMEWVRRPVGRGWGDQVKLFDRAAAFDAEAGDAVFCVSGLTWVTQGDGIDYTLSPGQTLTLRPSARVVVVPGDGQSRYRFCRSGVCAPLQQEVLPGGLICCPTPA